MHYLQHKNHSPAVFSSPRALRTKLMTHRFITSNPPSSWGQNCSGPSSSRCPWAKEKEERSLLCQPDAQPGARMCLQGRKLSSGYLQLSSSLKSS